MVALAVLLVVEGVSGIAGGAVFLLDTSGGIYGVPPNLLDSTPIGDYTLPGIWLIVAMGCYPIVVALALLREPNWRLIQPIERRFGIRWPWAATLLFGLGLLGWIVLELYYMGSGDLLHVVYGGIALLVIGLLFLPSVRTHYGNRQ